MTDDERGASDPVVITGAAVLTGVTDSLEGFTTALSKGHSAESTVLSESVTGRDERRDCRLLDFSLQDWAARHLGEEDRAHLVSAAGRSALPAQSGACVAADAVRAAGLDRAATDNMALIVAGNNLALDYHATALARFAADPRGVRPSHVLTHSDLDVVGVVSQTVGAHGEGFTVGAGPASGLVAAIQGIRLVRTRSVERCLVVAPVSELGPMEIRAYQKAGAMAPPDAPGAPSVCRPFDKGRSGFIYGHGAAAVVLESHAAAVARGAAPLALLSGAGMRLSGRRTAEPTPETIAAAVRAALADARVTASQVDYVNAHATGTVIGDAAEAAALGDVFAHSPGPWVNSTKALTGHCMTAAGLLELIAAVVQMRQGFCHPNPNLSDPLDSHLRFVGRGTEFTPVRTAVKNSFAMNGISAAIVLTSVEES